MVGTPTVRDAQSNEIRRGDRILDANGDIFMVKDTGPITMHIQNVKTGRRYTIGVPVFLKMPANRRFGNEEEDKEKLTTQKERKAYFNRNIVRRGH